MDIYSDYIKFIISFLILLIMILSFVSLFISEDDGGIHIVLVIIIYTMVAICCRINFSEVLTPHLLHTLNNNESELNQNSDKIKAIKVNNIKELDPNYSRDCCICLENIDLLDAYKLSNCKYHLFHENCIKSYIDNNFKKCPVCNIP